MRKVLWVLGVVALTWAFVGPRAHVALAQPFQHFFRRSPTPKPHVPAKPPAPSVVLGARLYVRACESCHGPKGNGEGFWSLPTAMIGIMHEFKTDGGSVCHGLYGHTRVTCNLKSEHSVQGSK
ncbi:hypothetical protein [Sulfobacillus thermotolerans]|uniref:c-type cytochrome n=1 Tax=Sulfobacillus thermotolerans TaxID=338644 RepID=UPI003367632B